MKDWFVGDYHFDHGNIMKYCNRPGLSQEEQKLLAAHEDFKVSRESVVRMNDMLIRETNAVVMPEDRLWCLGDVIFGGKKHIWANCRGFIDRINCKNIRLILGNHDKWMFEVDADFNMTVKPQMYELFRSVDKALSIRVGTHKIELSHYAHAVWDESHRSRLHLYGHSHAGAEDGLDAMMPGRRSFDVGVDNLIKLFGKMAPIDIDQINSVIGDQPGHSIDHHIPKKDEEWLGKDPDMREEGG